MAVTKLVHPEFEPKIHVETDLDETLEVVEEDATELLLFEVTSNSNTLIHAKFYNADPEPVLGTTEPEMIIPIHANTTPTLHFVEGLPFDKGLTAACVTSAGAGGTTGPTNPVSAVINYK